MKGTAMKNTVWALPFLAAAALAAGCNSSSEESGKSTSEQLDKVKIETKDAAQDMKNYAYAQKAEFVTKMQDKLAAINRDLDQLSVKIDKASDSVKAEAKPKLQALRDESTKLNAQLDKARSATESTWDDVKASFRKGYAVRASTITAAHMTVHLNLRAKEATGP